jgi:HPr kinase/phosphorylase
MQKTITIHGVFMRVFETGVLITGQSGTGKSLLALNLIDRGHQLVADDAPQFSIDANGNIIGTCPKLLSGFLSLPAVGVINVKKSYVDSVLEFPQSLELILHLTSDSDASCNRFQGNYETQAILDKNFPVLTLKAGNTDQQALLLESAILNLQLKKDGYDAYQELITKQQAELTYEC